MTADIKIENFAFDPIKPDGIELNLVMTAKRYTTSTSTQNTKGLTLLFTHSIGAFKECWEPTIETLYANHNPENESLRIREIWSFDKPNHGDAALINADKLHGRPRGVPASEFALQLLTFVNSPLVKGHRLVPIGHSNGCDGWMLATKYIDLSRIPYLATILVESGHMPSKVMDENSELIDFLVSTATKLTLKMKDRWASKEEALKFFSKSRAWSTYDPAAIKLVVEHGLYELPNGEGVTFKSPKEQQALGYGSETPEHREAGHQVGEVARYIPVYLIQGEISNQVPQDIRDTQFVHATAVSIVEGAGHMVVQEQPIALAKHISDMLLKIPSTPAKAPPSKL
ncbi:hypothetical protein FA15DRAFT_675110 [Coprinopsis marcescibilis]|uniref:AB hydrolase-1 domain-containing protein n=1 Tax=Coprinopsis marcescibilis TaxID=230819 RepID=A0A5C3KF13_COPMA|nr:hypothetical protein FA15DRAFT_675110 [Coprinopsis marcescibilis]